MLEIEVVGPLVLGIKVAPVPALVAVEHPADLSWVQPQGGYACRLVDIAQGEQAEEVRGQIHHALEAVQLLHQGVSILVDGHGAGFVDADPLGEQAVGLVETEDRP